MPCRTINAVITPREGCTAEITFKDINSEEVTLNIVRGRVIGCGEEPEPEDSYYELVDCDEIEDAITVNSDQLPDANIGDVYKKDGICWRINSVQEEGSIETWEPDEGPFTGESACEDCDAEPYIQLQDCDDSESTKIVKLSDIPGAQVDEVYKDGETCWKVIDVNASGPETGSITPSGEPYTGENACGDCLATINDYVIITNCSDNTGDIVVAKSDLPSYDLAAVYEDSEGNCWSIVGEDPGPSTGSVSIVATHTGPSACEDCQSPPEDGFCCGSTGVLPANGLIGDEILHVE